MAAKNASAVVQQQTFTAVKDQLTLLTQLAALRSEAARSVSNDKDKKKKENRSKDKDNLDETKKENKGEKYVGSKRTERFVKLQFKKYLKVEGLSLFVFSAFATLIISAAAITLSCNANFQNKKW